MEYLTIKSSLRRGRVSGISGLSVLLAAFASSFAGAAASTGSLKQLSVEELMNVEVYSASRHLEPTRAAPSAIFVLTNYDLRRSHATSIPEALRLVPGVQVGQVDGNKWAVSMRGFNSRETNKLLVLIDGRSIYDPLFSGTLWESQDLLLEDIDRIELIRGPGGTLWGANAFNGVINIVTRSADQTQGGLATVSAGDELRYTAAGRFGWQVTEHQFARVYAKAYERDTGYSSIAPHDGSRGVRGGFRWDWLGAGSDGVRVTGDLFDAHTGVRETPAFFQDVAHRGRYLVARCMHAFSDSNELQMQGYYDHVDYESFGYTQSRNTYDLEFQNSVHLNSRNLLVWGAGLREMRDRTRSGLSGLVDVLPLQRNDRIVNVFAQDTIALRPELLSLTLGLKYEQTDYAASEWLPNARVTYTPTVDRTWWASMGEATRVPSRLESDLTFFRTIRLGDNFGAEHVRSFELGHRQLVTPEIWYDVATFYGEYRDLRTGEAGGRLANLMQGHSKGAEIAIRWQPSAPARLDLAYTFLDLNLSLQPTSTSNPAQLSYTENLSPRHQVTLRVGIDVARDIEVDATGRHVGRLVSLDVPAYTELDLALTWTPTRQLAISIVGQNLLHAHHPEQDFAFSDSLGTQAQRGVFGKLTWQQ